MKTATHALVLMLALLGCTPTPRPPPPVDADATDVGASACARACQNLRTLGCDAGAAANCEAVCEHAQESGVVDLKPECVASARTVVELARCGKVTECAR